LKAHYLFDGEKKIRDGAVLTSDGQIEAAGSRSEIGDVDDAIVYDFGDATLMPGLIDCHDHLTSGLLEFGQNRYVSTSWAILKAANDLKLTLERGFTTVRDCGGLDLGVKKAVQAGLIPGPRLVISLVIVTQSAGLADYYIPGLDTYIPVPKMPGIPDGVANGVDQVRAKAREIIRAGADFLKIATTGGMGAERGSYAQSQYSLPEVEALVQEGKAFGLPTAAHAYCGVGLKNALRAGVWSVEHLGDVDDDDLRFMASQGIFLVPTLCVARYSLETARDDTVDTPRVRNARRLVEIQKERVRRAVQLGVKVCLGTDIGAFVHGENARELQYLSEAGLPATLVLQSATSVAAQCLQLEDEIGYLKAGYDADILVASGDVTLDVSSLRSSSNILGVFKSGKPVALSDEPVSQSQTTKRGST
jgi:imidazolonepropionase-like amidohydrolase